MKTQVQSDPDMGRLRWRCRRGMRELDRLLSGFLERSYRQSSVEEQQGFRDLLELQDPVLYAYFIGRERPPNGRLAALVDRISAVGGQP